MQHLRGESNALCYTHYYSDDKVPNVNPEPTNKRSSPCKKQKLISELEQALNNPRAPVARNQPDPAPNIREESSDGDAPIADNGYLEDDDAVPPEESTTHETFGGCPEDATKHTLDAGEGLSSGLIKFKQYLNKSSTNCDLQPNQVAAVELMNLMNTKGGSIELYHAVLEWHVKHLKGNQQETVKADKLHGDLINRYDMEDVLPYEVMTRLDSAQGEVPVVCHDCEAQTISV